MEEKRGRFMKIKFLGLAGVTIALLASLLSSQPDYNGSAAGCSGSSCHTFNDNAVSAVSVGNLEVQVTVTGVQSGEKVAGELVDFNGTVVDTVNPTTTNPFVLTAPGSGKYLVNAGYKKPTRTWDSVTVDIDVASIYPDQDPNGLIRSFKLSQNYPNPFNPSTMIGFFLPKSEFVILKIYNFLGQEVTTLVSERLAAGQYEYDWDASGMASGIYLYRIQAGDYVESRKMVLMK
jgi:hypothetical protein